jgi:cytochrome c
MGAWSAGLAALGRLRAAALGCSLLVLAGCGGAAPSPNAAKPADQAAKPADKAAAAVAGDPESGKQLFAAKGCVACHVAPGVPGATGTIGPNLGGIGDPQKRPQLAGNLPNTPENLRRWIRDPGMVKPGTMMPNLNLTEKEADDLVALLTTLR